jgi:hypothetical protein
MTNLLEPANEEANEENKYHCDCGCNLDFIDYEPGFDVYVGNSWIITSDAMVKYSWCDYISMHEFKLWNDFREDIVLNYNYALNTQQAKDMPWIHLYNKYGNSNIPLNEKLYYEYVI